MNLSMCWHVKCTVASCSWVRCLGPVQVLTMIYVWTCALDNSVCAYVLKRVYVLTRVHVLTREVQSCKLQLLGVWLGRCWQWRMTNDQLISWLLTPARVPTLAILLSFRHKTIDQSLWSTNYVGPGWALRLSTEFLFSQYFYFHNLFISTIFSPNAPRTMGKAYFSKP